LQRLNEASERAPDPKGSIESANGRWARPGDRQVWGRLSSPSLCSLILCVEAFLARMRFATLTRVLDKNASTQKMLRYQSEGEERKQNIRFCLTGSTFSWKGSQRRADRRALDGSGPF